MSLGVLYPHPLEQQRCIQLRILVHAVVLGMSSCHLQVCQASGWSRKAAQSLLGLHARWCESSCSRSGGGGYAGPMRCPSFKPQHAQYAWLRFLQHALGLAGCATAAEAVAAVSAWRGGTLATPAGKQTAGSDSYRPGATVTPGLEPRPGIGGTAGGAVPPMRAPTFSFSACSVLLPGTSADPDRTPAQVPGACNGDGGRLGCGVDAGPAAAAAATTPSPPPTVTRHRLSRCTGPGDGAAALRSAAATPVSTTVPKAPRRTVHEDEVLGTSPLHDMPVAMRWLHAGARKKLGADASRPRWSFCVQLASAWAEYLEDFVCDAGYEEEEDSDEEAGEDAAHVGALKNELARLWGALAGPGFLTTTAAVPSGKENDSMQEVALELALGLPSPPGMQLPVGADTARSPKRARTGPGRRHQSPGKTKPQRAAAGASSLGAPGTDTGTSIRLAPEAGAGSQVDASGAQLAEGPESAVDLGAAYQRACSQRWSKRWRQWGEVCREGDVWHEWWLQGVVAGAVTTLGVMGMGDALLR